jgi:hypothetical protein
MNEIKKKFTVVTHGNRVLVGYTKSKLYTQQPFTLSSTKPVMFALIVAGIHE